MRARVKLDIDPSRSWDDLRAALDHANWIPSLAADSPSVLMRRREILADIGAENKEAASETTKLVIFDEANEAWGLVNNVTGRTYTIRIKHPDREALKRSSARLVEDLQSSMVHLFRDRRPAFTFQPQIDVLLPESNQLAFQGTVLPPKRFRAALQERRSEAALGLAAFLAAGTLLVVTAPPFLGPPMSGADSWYVWATGNLERLSTAALVTAAVSWLEVVIRWFQLRRQPTIRWRE